MKFGFVANLPVSLPVKEFWKSVNIWGTYGQEFGVLYFLRHSVEHQLVTDRRTDKHRAMASGENEHGKNRRFTQWLRSAGPRVPPRPCLGPALSWPSEKMISNIGVKFSLLHAASTDNHVGLWLHSQNEPASEELNATKDAISNSSETAKETRRRPAGQPADRSGQVLEFNVA